MAKALQGFDPLQGGPWVSRDYHIVHMYECIVEYIVCIVGLNSVECDMIGEYLFVYVLRLSV